MARSGIARRKRKYRLKPSARRFYRRLLILLLVLMAIVLAVRLIFLRSTYRLADYDVSAPFAVQELVEGVLKPREEGDIILMDVRIRSDELGVITDLEMDFIELLDKENAQEWLFYADGAKAVLKKGEKLKGNYTQQKERFPPLKETLASLARIPFTDLSREQSLSEGQSLYLDTQYYRPDVNPAFTEHAAEAREVKWVPASGTMSTVQADYKPISSYMAIDVSLESGEKKAAPSFQYVLLLETRLQ